MSKIEKNKEWIDECAQRSGLEFVDLLIEKINGWIDEQICSKKRSRICGFTH